ncbi:MAG: phytoene desaturase family protein [Nocardioides sp.]
MYDAVIVGAGHNGLTAAAYLSRAGASVLLLERLDHVGGAAISAAAFSGHPTRLSRYSYLVSMMPDRLVDELGLDIGLASRSVASYTPIERAGQALGLLVERPEGPGTAASFRALTGGDEDFVAWRDFYAQVGELADVVAPTVLAPLPTENVIRSQVPARIWTDLVEQPIGMAIERRFRDDVVRGVVGTDALIGTFASLHDPSLVQNRCFLYHLIGNGTGEWRVPIGGMGAVTAALEKAAAGADRLTSAEVTSVEVGTDCARVTWRDRSGPHAVDTRFVLSGCAPWVMDRLMGLEPTTKPEGAQLKVNFLLDRLPRLRSGIDPEIAFAGTLHLAESMSQLERAHQAAVGGKVPDPLPGEVYCHSLTDASILGGERAHTLTYFGLHTPASILDRPQAKQTAVLRAIASLDAILDEPILSVVATDAHGQPCIEAKTPSEIEADLAMPGGHIFHGDLDWPWAGVNQQLDTPAQRWGVDTAASPVLRCGAGAQRGGAVSGIGGHNAAQAVLEML